VYVKPLSGLWSGIKPVIPHQTQWREIGDESRSCRNGEERCLWYEMTDATARRPTVN